MSATRFLNPQPLVESAAVEQECEFHLSESSLSHDQVRDALRAALNPGGMDINGTMPSRYPREVYDDYVIYEESSAAGQALYKRTYVIADDGTVTLGDPQRVEQVTTYQPLNEALQGGALLEAVDTEGWNWRVQIIQSGISANGNDYPLTVLQEAAPVYSGVPVFYGRGPDHSPNERGFNSVAGYITAPTANARGVEGTLEINKGKPELREAIRHAWDVKARTGRDTFGFSHVVPKGGAIVEARKPKGYRVTKITKADSVDIVMQPAAGGSLLAPLSESQQTVPDALQEAIVNVAALLAKLREGKKLSMDELAFLQENSTPQDIATALTEAAASVTPPVVELTATQGLVSEATATSALATLTESVDKRIADMEQRAALAEARATLTSTLAESRLPDDFRTAIAADFDGRLFEASDLTARIDRDRAIAAKYVGNRVSGLGVAVTQDQTDTFQMAMDGLFQLPNDKGVKPFRSLKEAYLAMSGRDLSYASAELPRAILRESAVAVPTERDGELQEAIISSTFSNAMGDSITRKMIQQYNLPQYQSWEKIVTNKVALSDFRTQDRIRIGGYGVLPPVNQGAPYQLLTTPADQQATYALTKHGGLETITLEAIANDDMGVIRRVPVNLGRAGIRSLYTDVWTTTISSNATCTYDSLALYHATHANTNTNALSAANLLAAENAMRNQTAYGESLAVLGAGNQPKYLVIPNALRDTAFRLTQSGVAVGAGTYSAEPNIFAGTGYEIIVVDEFTDANDWYLFADPQMTPMLEVGFFGGNETPELFVQDQPTVGSNFTADVVTFKIRFIYGIGILEHRGTYRNVV